MFYYILNAQFNTFDLPEYTDSPGCEIRIGSESDVFFGTEISESFKWMAIGWTRMAPGKFCTSWPFQCLDSVFLVIEKKPMLKAVIVKTSDNSKLLLFF